MRKTIAYLMGTFMLGAATFVAQPVFAAGPEAKASCSAFANSPVRSSGSVSSKGGRTLSCSNLVSTTVKLKGVRTAMPDSVLNSSTWNTINGSVTLYFHTPTSGSRYFTETNAADGSSARSANITY